MPATTTILLTVALLLLAAIAGELLVRRSIRRGKLYAVYAPGSRVRLELDRATHPTLEPVVTYSINRDGERGPEPPADARGLYRVLVTGGSAAEGFLNDQDSCWPMALGARLSAPESLAVLRRTRVHVGTIGRSGFDAAALERTCRQILPRYRTLDAIIVITGAGDVMRWLAASTPQTGDGWESTVRETFAWHPELRFAWTPRRLALAESYRRLRARLTVERHCNAAAWMGRARRARVGAWERGELLEHTPDASVLLDAYERRLSRALEIAQGHARRVVIVLQPMFVKERPTDEERAHLWNGGQGQAYRDDVRTFYSDAVLERLMAAINERTRRVAQDRGVEVLDPAPALDFGLHHFFDHAHFTPAGAAVVARVVADHLLAGAPATAETPAGITHAPATAASC